MRNVVEKTVGKKEEVTITAPNFKEIAFLIRGDAPLVQNKFSAKAMQQMKEAQEAGSVNKKGKKRTPKDFERIWRGAMHISQEGWHGLPAGAFRNGMISACRIAGFKMTHAKLSVFVLEDGFDEDDATPLVQITKGEPLPFSDPRTVSFVRNETGVVDIRPRPMWLPGWEALVRVRFDNDQFSVDDIANLMMRVGMQVGIGEGRPDSRRSAGRGWGTFQLAQKEV